MASSHKLISLTILSLIIGFASSHDDTTNDICSRIQFPAVCTATAAMYASSLPAVVTAKNLLDVHVERAIAAAEAGRISISRKLDRLSANVGDMEKQAFTDCMGTFNDIADNLKAGTASIEKKDLSTAQSSFGTAMSMCSECDDDFLEAIMSNPVQKHNVALHNIVSNAFDLAKMI